MNPRAGNPSAVELLESNLIHGGARWIADLTEFFRDYRTNDTTFALYAKGRTRARGFFLSRFFAWTVLPNYAVSLFCADEKNTILTVEKIRKNMDAVAKFAEREDLKWSWLILFSSRELSPSVVSFISRYEKPELGLAVASTASQQIILSNNQIGRSIGKQLNLLKVVRSVELRKD